MIGVRRFRWYGLAVAALAAGGLAVLASTTGTAPASAGVHARVRPADAAPDLTVSVQTTAVSANGSKLVEVLVRNTGDADATNVSLHITGGSVNDKNYWHLITDSQRCEPWGQQGQRVHDIDMTCHLGTIPAGERDHTAFYNLSAWPDGDAPRGPGLTMQATVGSDATDADPSDNTASATIAVTDPGVDLQLYDLSPLTITPGGTGKLSTGFLNNGSHTTHHVRLSATLPDTVTAVTASAGTCSVGAGGHGIECDITTDQNGQPLSLSKGKGLSANVTVQVAGDAPAGTVLGEATTTVTPLDENDVDDGDNTAVTTVRAGATG